MVTRFHLKTCLWRLSRFLHVYLFVILILSAFTLYQGAANAANLFQNTLMSICDGVTEIPTSECLILETLYNSTGGETWRNNTNWLVTNTPSDWYGVTVEGGHVIRLSLGSNRLINSIPPELGNLAALQDLDLQYNSLIGSIPPELGNLVDLQYLDFSRCQLTGSIPPELGNLASLQYLNLYSWYPYYFNGSIPPELGNLIALQYLNLSGNRFTGSIPPELGNLVALQKLYLSSNQLTGSIPPELGNLVNVETLSLHNNMLTGNIPPEIGNLTSVQYLYLNNNQLSGSIPPEFGNLVSLVETNLERNQLTGSIPPELGNLTSLKWLDLPGNLLSGSIPPELGNLSSLEWLDLGGNQLTGNIPPELGNLASLQALWLFFNELTGNIPPELGNLAALETLYINYNPLSGSVPLSFISLSNLTYFDFSETDLCEPTTPEYLAWKATVYSYRGTGISCIEPCTLVGFGDEFGNPIQQHTDAMNVPYGGGEFTLVDGSTVFLPFDWTPPTDYIYEWGCKLISGAMTINYFAEQQGVAHRTDPITLNNWMAHNITNNNSGYYSGVPLDDNNLVNWVSPTHVHWATVKNITLVEYARAHGIDMALEYSGVRDDVILDSAMCNYSPAILGVNSNGHYVAASGKTTVRDIPTWRLHDPLASLPTNLLDEYENEYGSLVVYSGSTPKSAISLALYSPAEILITDPEDRRTGIDPRTGTEYEEIPSSSYMHELLHADDGTLGVLELKILSIIEPISGEYSIEIIGTGSGAIGFEITTLDPDGEGSQMITSDTIIPGEVIEYQMNYSPTSTNIVPIAIEDTYELVTGTTLNIDATNGVLANDTDVDGDQLTALLVSETPNGDLILNLDGSFAYQPYTSFIGTDIFTYQAFDGTDVSSPTEVRIYVKAYEFSCNAITEITQTECEALVALYNGTGGDSWTNSTNWLTDTWPWYGVTVSSGHVIEIRLSENNLSGNIPPQLGDLAGLEALWLDYNQLTGSIPTELGNLTDLQHLWLYSNQLTGSIPLELGNLSALSFLNLGNNQLIGSIPTELGNLTSLTGLDLSFNLLTGSIPSELSTLTALSYLDLGNNQLTGSIPPDLGNLIVLWNLALYNNQLTGSIPPELGDLVSLTNLDLRGNQLTGSIPVELGNLISLQWLYLYTNQLTGSIPLSFVNFVQMETFYFYDTYLCEPTAIEYLTWKAAVLDYQGTGVSCGLPTPEAPDNLLAIATSQSQIDLTWVDNATNETGFEIECSLDGVTDWVLIATIGANTPSYSDTGLNTYTTYYYRVRAINDYGTSDHSNIASTTTYMTFHVGDLEGRSTSVSNSKWAVTVTITIHDHAENPVNGAIITGGWSTGGSGTCTTGIDGTCSVTLQNLTNKVRSAVFTVSDVSKNAYVYISDLNHDVDGDSDGTSIEVTKPKKR